MRLQEQKKQNVIIAFGKQLILVTFLPNGSRAFVTNENDGTLSVIDTASLEVTGTIPFGEGMKPMGQAMSPDGSRLYVTTGRGKKLFVIDPSANSVLASFEVGNRPWGVGLSPDGKLAFTANGPSNDVSIVDLEKQSVIKKIKAGDRPWGVLISAR